MGDPERLPLASGLSPEGYPVFNAAFITSLSKENEWWSKAELRAAELITSIQPNRASEERRHAVVEYVKRLIEKSVACQVVTFGSVPLKTYLPDGDIDLTAFSHSNEAKRCWIQDVFNVLWKAQHHSDSGFRVKEVHLIQAEVKVIKCFVENIMVDISFNQLGGVCTLCFLEEVDRLIGEDHLFKRSIILVKAWCYYESRILGAHFGLISTYALETLVLYIFHVFHGSLRGPFQVLYMFLEFFSNFDWDKFCVSLWGPIPITSLPEVAGRRFVAGDNLQKLALSPWREGGELLLTEAFLDACSITYGVKPTSQDLKANNLYVKFLNISDPLRSTNNLGRSVNKGSFARIRSAFTYGARTLRSILKCPEEDITSELYKFFGCTLKLHGSRFRPDAVDPRSFEPWAHTKGVFNVSHQDRVANGDKESSDNPYRYSHLPKNRHPQSTKLQFSHPGWTVPAAFTSPQIPQRTQEGLMHAVGYQGASAAGTWPSAPVTETSVKRDTHKRDASAGTSGVSGCSDPRGSKWPLHHIESGSFSLSTSGNGPDTKKRVELNPLCESDNQMHAASVYCEQDVRLLGTPTAATKNGRNGGMEKGTTVNLEREDGPGTHMELNKSLTQESEKIEFYGAGLRTSSPSSSGCSKADSDEEECVSEFSSKDEDTVFEKCSTLLPPETEGCTRETNPCAVKGLSPLSYTSVTLSTAQPGHIPVHLPGLMPNQSTPSVSSLTLGECASMPMHAVHSSHPLDHLIPESSSLDLASPFLTHLVHLSIPDGSADNCSVTETESRASSSSVLEEEGVVHSTQLQSNLVAEAGDPMPKTAPDLSIPGITGKQIQNGSESQAAMKVSHVNSVTRRKGRGHRQVPADKVVLEGSAVMNGKPRRSSGSSKVGWHVDNNTGKAQGGGVYVAQDGEVGLASYQPSGSDRNPQQFGVKKSGSMTYPYGFADIHPTHSFASGSTDVTTVASSPTHYHHSHSTTGQRVVYNPLGNFHMASTMEMSDVTGPPYWAPVPEIMSRHSPISHYQSMYTSNNALPLFYYPYLSMYYPGINIYKVASHTEEDAGTGSMTRHETNGSIGGLTETSSDSRRNNSNSRLDEQVPIGVAERLRAVGIPVSTASERDDTIVERNSDGAEPSANGSDLLTSDFGHHLSSLAYGRYCHTAHSLGADCAPPAYSQKKQIYNSWGGPGRPDTNYPNCIGLMPFSPFSPGILPFMYQTGANQYQQQYLTLQCLSPRPRGTGTYLPNPLQRHNVKRSGNGRGASPNGSFFPQDRHSRASERDGTYLSHGPRHRAQPNKNESRPQTQSNASSTLVGQRTLRTERGPNLHNPQHQLMSQFISTSHPTGSPVAGKSLLAGNGHATVNCKPFAEFNGGVSHGIEPSSPESPIVVYPVVDSSMTSPQASVDCELLGQTPGGGDMNGTHIGTSPGAKFSHDQGTVSAPFVNSGLTDPVAEVLQSTSTQRIVQRTYQMKEEDFPPLSFRRQHVNGSNGGSGSSTNSHVAQMRSSNTFSPFNESIMSR